MTETNNKNTKPKPKHRYTKSYDAPMMKGADALERSIRYQAKKAQKSKEEKAN